MLRSVRAGTALRRLELVLVIGAALFALGFHLTLPSRLASEEDWRALAAHLTQETAPGDAVILHPWWTDEARLHLPGSLPVHGDPHGAGDAWVEAPRLWVIAQPSLPRADMHGFERAFLPGREPLGPAVHFGPLQLRAYRNLRHRPIAFDASAALARAQAWIETPGSPRRACRRAKDGFNCPGAGHLRAGLHEIDFAPVQCLTLPPPTGAARLVVEFRDVPRTGHLLFESGIVGEEAWKRAPDLTPLTLGIASNGEVLHEQVLPAGSEGRTQRELDEAAGAPRSLRIWSSAMHPGRRVPCVNLRALGPAMEGAR